MSNQSPLELPHLDVYTSFMLQLLNGSSSLFSA